MQESVFLLLERSFREDECARVVGAEKIFFFSTMEERCCFFEPSRFFYSTHVPSFEVSGAFGLRQQAVLEPRRCVWVCESKTWFTVRSSPCCISIGTLLASGSDDHNIIIWECPDLKGRLRNKDTTGKVVIQTGHVDNIFGVNFLNGDQVTCIKTASSFCT